MGSAINNRSICFATENDQVVLLAFLETGLNSLGISLWLSFLI